MRHARKGKKIGGSASHKKIILRNLAREVLKHEKIKTTQVKASEVRSLVDKVITLGKRGDLHARRQVLSIINDKEVVHKVFSEISLKYENRQGGYTRILKTGLRMGDSAPMVVIELV